MAMRKAVLSITAIILFAAAPAFASETRSAPLPDQVVASLSVKSAMDLLQTADGFLVTILDKTPQSYQQGLLPMLAPMFLPSPIVSVNLEEPGHILLLAGGQDFDRPVFVGSVAAYADFIAAITPAESEATVSGAVTNITTREDMDVYVIDAGNSLVAVAMQEQDALDAAAALKNWLPSAPATTISIQFNKASVFNSREMLAFLYAQGIDELMENSEEVIESAADADLDADMIKGAFTLIRRIADVIPAEAAKFDGGKLDITIDGDHLSLSTVIWPGEGSLIGDTVNKARNLENALFDIGRAVNDDAGMYVQMMPMTDIMPGTPAQWRQFISDAIKDIAPGLEDKAAALSDAILAAGPKETVQGILSGNEIITYTRMDDPAKGLNAIFDTYKLYDEMLSRFLKEGDQRKTRFVFSEEKEGDLAYRKVIFEAAEDSSLWELLEDADIDPAMLNQALSSISILLTATDKVLVIANGDITPDQLVQAVKALGGADAPFIETAWAKGALGALSHRQIGFGISKVSAITVMLLEKLISSDNMPEEFRNVLKAAIPDLVTSDATFAFSHGIKEEGYSAELILDAQGINDMVQNYFLITSREAHLTGEEDAGEYDDLDEEYYDDDEEEEAEG